MRNVKGGRWRYKRIVFVKYTVYNTGMQNFQGGRWCYKLVASVQYIYIVSNTKVQNDKGGRWHYKLVVSMIYTQSTIQGCSISGVDVGATNLYYP